MVLDHNQSINSLLIGKDWLFVKLICMTHLLKAPQQCLPLPIVMSLIPYNWEDFSDVEVHDCFLEHALAVVSIQVHTQHLVM